MYFTVWVKRYNSSEKTGGLFFFFYKNKNSVWIPIKDTPLPHGIKANLTGHDENTQVFMI